MKALTSHQQRHKNTARTISPFFGTQGAGAFFAKNGAQNDSQSESFFKQTDSRIAQPTAASAKRSVVSEPIIQRVIDNDAFARLDNSIVETAPQPFAQLKRDADNVQCLARRVSPPATGFEVSAKDDLGNWVSVSVDTLKANYSWSGEKVVYSLPKSFEKDKSKRKQVKTKGADQLNQVGDGGNALTINEFAGDDLAMVHHTTGGGSEPHLTVENAHISALHHIADMRTIVGFNKGGKNKPEHEAFMSGYGSAPTDNLNFFAAGGENSVHNLSLAEYLQVIGHAMDQIENVPPVYGVELIRSANAMAEMQNMNPAELFLPSGVGQERQLFKAALNMHKMGLIAVPATIVTAFDGYAQSKPQLTDPDSGQVLIEGSAGWNDLQNRLISEHLQDLIGYLKTLSG